MQFAYMASAKNCSITSSKISWKPHDVTKSAYIIASVISNLQHIDSRYNCTLQNQNLVFHRHSGHDITDLHAHHQFSKPMHVWPNNLHIFTVLGTCINFYALSINYGPINASLCCSLFLVQLYL